MDDVLWRRAAMKRRSNVSLESCQYSDVLHIMCTVPGPNNEVDLTKFFRKVNEFWYNEANNEENNEVILGQFSGF